MCRLLAYVARERRSAEDAVGRSTLSAFTSLARVHGDGWGAAWTTPDRPGGITAHRSTTSAAADPVFAATAEQVRARAALLHLRWATPGLAVNPANTHPFLADGWAFAHNGFIGGSEQVLGLLSRRQRTSLRGTTDSERYFRLVPQCAEDTGDIVAGLQAASRLVRDLAGSVSVNAMLLSSSRLLAVRGLTGAPPPTTGLLAVVAHPDQLPPDHLEGYYQLSYRHTGDGLVIASSGLPSEGWTPVPPDTVMDVHIRDGRWTWHALLPETRPGSAHSASIGVA